MPGLDDAAARAHAQQLAQNVVRLSRRNLVNKITGSHSVIGAWPSSSGSGTMG